MIYTLYMLDDEFSLSICIRTLIFKDVCMVPCM